MYGPHSTWSSSRGFKLLDSNARNLPGVERLSLYEGGRTVHSYVDGRKISSALKRTDDEFWKILRLQLSRGRAVRRVGRRGGAVRRGDQRPHAASGSSTAGRRSARRIEADGQRFRVIGVVENVSEAAADAVRRDLGAVHDRQDRRLQA